MRAETVKRMILLSVAEPPEDLEELEELLELYARLWARENAELLTEGRREPVNGDREEEIPEPQPEDIPEEQPEPEEETREDPPEPEEDAPKEERKWNENAILGFAHIRCAHCGAEKTFTAKHWMNRYTCASCGQETWLYGAVRKAEAQCECGVKSVYSTNVEEAAFDIPCVKCGAPMPVVWVPGRNRYEPAGGKMAARRRKK